MRDEASDRWWTRFARRVTGAPGNPEWRLRFRRLVGPSRYAIDQPEFLCFAVEQGVRPWREKYQPRY